MTDHNYWNVVWSRPYGRYNRQHQKIWDALVPFIVGEVCDIGCGPCLMYEGKDVDLTGVDFSEKAIDEASINYPLGKYVVADCRDTGLGDGKFDTVILSGLLDYFDDWKDVVNEAKRISKKDAKIIGTLCNGYAGHDWTKYPHITGQWHYVNL